MKNKTEIINGVEQESRETPRTYVQITFAPQYRSIDGGPPMTIVKREDDLVLCEWVVRDEDKNFNDQYSLPPAFIREDLETGVVTTYHTLARAWFEEITLEEIK